MIVFGPLSNGESLHVSKEGFVNSELSFREYWTSWGCRGIQKLLLWASVDSFNMEIYDLP